jgi:ketopantoate reductase
MKHNSSCNTFNRSLKIQATNALNMSTNSMSGAMSPIRVAIIGVGQVGGATAYALILASLADHLLLVDVDPEVRDAQVNDLSDAAMSSNSRTGVCKATYKEASQCDVVVITAGSKYTVGQLSISSPQVANSS